MAVLKSGASSDLQTVDPTSKAARVTLYDSAGRELAFGGKATYAAATGAFTPPATPTDMSTIFGSATKTIRIIACHIAGIQTATGINLFNLVKRSAVNTAGTFVAATAVPVDSANVAATATVGHYTANPTGLGAAVGNMRTARVCCSIATGLAGPPVDLLMFGRNDELSQLPTLRGVAQGLAVNFGGAALPAGLTMAVEWVWLEE